MILEGVLIGKRRFHPWMYISIYTIGAIFPALLFPLSGVDSIRVLTLTLVIIQWSVCAGCIVHGILVARRLANERRRQRDIDADAAYAESIYQDDEREAREGELVLIDEDTTFGSQEVSLEQPTTQGVVD